MRFTKDTINYFVLFASIEAVATRYNPISKSCFLCSQQQNISNYLTMVKTKIFRHAQTQHGDNTADFENIVLCKANIFTPIECQVQQEHGVINNGSENIEHYASDKLSVVQKTNDAITELGSESPQRVWVFDVEDGVNYINVKLLPPAGKENPKIQNPEKRRVDDFDQLKDLKKAKLETKALKAKRPGFTDERYHETSYYIENGLRKVYPYYFTFTTFTKGRWVSEKILDVFSREFRAHPAEEYERCIKSGTLTVNYEKVPVDYRLKHNDLLANIVHRHEVPVTSQPITIVHMDDDIVVVNKPASIPVHPCGRYRHNTVVFILAKEYNLKNLRTIHRLDRLTSGLLLFGRSPKKARQMEHQIRNRQVQKEYICRVEGDFPEGTIECNEPIEVVSYKIGVCKVSQKGKECSTTFQKISYNGKTSVVLCKPLTGRMHQIRVHLQYLGFPVVNDPLYNHEVFGPLKGRGGDIGGKTDEALVRDLINIHNAENWLGVDCDSDISMFKTIKGVNITSSESESKGHGFSDNGSERISRETSPTWPNSSSQKKCIETAYAEKKKAAIINNLTTADTPTYSKVHEENDSNSHIKVTVATQTGHESPDMSINAGKTTSDKFCYECTVRYRDPKPKDLVMYLHAWKYKGSGWEYETLLPNWGSADWIETD